MYNTTYHRDSTCTIWDCHSQQWTRTDSPSDELLAALSPDERARVRMHCAGVRSTWRQRGPDRPYSGGALDPRCAGGVEWSEYRSYQGTLWRRTVYASAGNACSSPAEQVSLDEL